MHIDDAILNRLFEISSNCTLNNKHVAAIFRSNKLIKFAVNDPFYHAEHSVIKNIDARNTTILVVRFSAGKINLGNSKPCDDCLRMMTAAGVKKVCYSTGDNTLVDKLNVMDRVVVKKISSMSISNYRSNHRNKSSVEPINIVISKIYKCRGKKCSVRIRY